ncbi:MAG: AAA family ATPase [Candidatus Marinimicrobia bacterium]|nr:AAA family ATPase [Candidatus Neomarinimicrobiota bacterium]
MYESYWKLKEKPFENTPDPKFLYRSREHEEAMIRLLYAIHSNKGCALLTGDYGCGKTLLMYTIIKELSQGPFEIAYLTNPRWTPIELIKEILYQLDIETNSDSKLDLVHKLNDFLYDTARKQKHTIVIIDEAQEIKDPDIYEELRLLLNFQLNDRFLLTLFLVGQNELKELIQKIPQFNQRIAIKYHLKPFDLDDTKSYIEYRIRVAGREDSMFTQDAYEMIFEKSDGIPRLINNICDLCLVIGYGKKLEKIDSSIVREVSL